MSDKKDCEPLIYGILELFCLRVKSDGHIDKIQNSDVLSRKYPYIYQDPVTLWFLLLLKQLSRILMSSKHKAENQVNGICHQQSCQQSEKRGLHWHNWLPLTKRYALTAVALPRQSHSSLTQIVVKYLEMQQRKSICNRDYTHKVTITSTFYSMCFFSV